MPGFQHYVSVHPFPYRVPNGNGKSWNSILLKRMTGNGKLTETENVIFYVSYGILTDKSNSYVFF